MFRKPLLLAEFLVIFILGPLLGLLALPSLGKLAFLLIAAAYAAWRVKLSPCSWALRQYWPGILLRTGAFLIIAGTTVRWLQPEQFCRFPQTRPGFWLLIMILYPVLSAWPQEILYRHFFFTRFSMSSHLVIPLNALLFAWLHIGYLNLPALILSGAGGLVLARQWQRHGNLAAVTIEHALYGMTIFTVGLGHYFYRG